MNGFKGQTQSKSCARSAASSNSFHRKKDSTVREKTKINNMYDQAGS